MIGNENKILSSQSYQKLSKHIDNEQGSEFWDGKKGIFKVQMEDIQPRLGES